MRIQMTLVAGLLLSGCASALHQVPGSSGSVVEFRFAHTDPAPGLIEVVNQSDGSLAFVENEVLVSDADIQEAKVIEGQLGEPLVEIFFTAAGSARIRELSRENIGRSLAIFANGQLLVSVPIRGELNLPSAILVAEFDLAEARRIAAALNQAAAVRPAR